VADRAILVEGLTKRFGDVVALDGVDFEVPAGTIFGLLGPNGAGKTTCIRVLSTILIPDSGRAEVQGHDVVRDPQEVRYSIGLAGQYAAVDPNLTGRENLRLIGKLAHLRRADIMPRAGELLERFDLSDAADRPVRTYSGGMRRRLDLAAALVQRPPVLFLDEPTTGLDIQSRTELWTMIRELVSEGTTVLLTTQYLEEADRLCSHLVVVDGGRVIANDAPQTLKAKLGSAVIDLEMASETAARKAERVLKTRVDGLVERDRATVRFTAGEGPSELIGVLRSLDGEKVTPVSLIVREPSLDDVFLQLTGHHAEPAAEEAEAAAPAAGRRGRRQRGAA
jgi:ABC-2 type transport system ATP-binding protein